MIQPVSSTKDSATTLQRRYERKTPLPGKLADTQIETPFFSLGCCAMALDTLNGRRCWTDCGQLFHSHGNIWRPGHVW